MDKETYDLYGLYNSEPSDDCPLDKKTQLYLDSLVPAIKQFDIDANGARMYLINQGINDAEAIRYLQQKL